MSPFAVPTLLRLQWSHGRLTVVTDGAGTNPDLFRAASMEPRSFNRGDGPKSEQKIRIVMLQWSHGRLTVVTIRWWPQGHQGGHASMEPRSFNRGDSMNGWKYQQGGDDASMEPRSFNRGDLSILPVFTLVKLASMEPRSFNRGDVTSITRSGRSVPSFNGATVV